jgi:hypothetical protein
VTNRGYHCLRPARTLTAIFCKVAAAIGAIWFVSVASAAEIIFISRAQIPTTHFGGVQQVQLIGYRTANDKGFGAVYTRTGASSTGWQAIQDADGNWWNLVLGQRVDTGWFGAYANGGSQAITSGDISANPAWRGTYTLGMTWDYVAVQEAMYAAFANAASTPGHVAWNATSAGGYNYTANISYFVTSGNYSINNQILTVATHGRVDFGPRGAAQWNWSGGVSQTMWKCDACSYMQVIAPYLSNPTTESWGSAKPIWSIDWDGAYNSLKIQQITVYDGVFSVGTNGQGVAIGPTGGSQGDTIAFINPLFIGFDSDWALYIGSANALSITLTNGDFQGFYHDSIQVYGGSVYTYGTHSENQNSNTGTSSPIYTQFTTNGADVHIYGAVNGSTPSTIVGWRAEDNIISSSAAVASGGTYFGLNDGYSVIDSGAIGVDIAPWFANNTSQRGTVWYGGTNFSRAFMMVDAGGTQWANITSGSGNTISDSAASYTANQWVGYKLRLRFGSNGVYEQCNITASTATTITHDAGCPAFTTENSYEVAGTTGAVSPNFDSAANGHTTYNGTITTAPGSACVDVDLVTYNNISVNDYMAVIDGDSIGGGGAGATGPLYRMPLYGKVLSKAASGCHGGAQSVTLNHASGPNTPAGNQLWAYYGTPISDGTQGVQWIELNYSSFTSPDSAMSAYPAIGSRVDMVGNNNHVYTNRPDYARTSVQTATGVGQTTMVNSTVGVNIGSQCSTMIGPASPVDLSPWMNSCNGVFSIPSGNTTFNAPQPNGVQDFTMVFQPGNNYTITFGTNFNNVPPLNLGNSGLLQMIHFRSYGGGGGWFEVGRSVVPNTARTTTNFSATNTTTLANVTGLSVPLLAGAAYEFRAVLYVLSGGSSGGTKAAINASPSGITSGVFAGWGMDSGTTPVKGYAQSRTLTTPLASAAGYTSDNPTIVIEGTVVPLANTTLSVQFAQNTANATPTIVQDGSTLTVTRLP